MAKAAQRQFLTKVSGVDGFFAKKTGGNPKSTATKVWDGGTLTPDIITSTPEFDDLSVRRPYDPVRDAPVLARLRPLVGSSQHTIEVTPTDAVFQPVAGPTTYSGTLMGLSFPDVDATSSEGAEFELLFSIRSAS